MREIKDLPSWIWGSPGPFNDDIMCTPDVCVMKNEIDDLHPDGRGLDFDLPQPRSSPNSVAQWKY